ncbi:unnamed protein product [Anisakis simplex]|uniref:Transposase n=1 Tax=Anisakis simplex TaxID=6269 RepID=A0A0M3KJS6_ANISI|nr:unnamed protein product [Anisakis simplex]
MITPHIDIFNYTGRISVNGVQVGEKKHSVEQEEDDGKVAKSVLQGKLSALAIQIGYIGKLFQNGAFKQLFHYGSIDTHNLFACN